MSTFDKANWLYVNGFFSNLIFSMSETDIDAIYSKVSGNFCPTCGEG